MVVPLDDNKTLLMSCSTEKGNRMGFRRDQCGGGGQRPNSRSVVLGRLAAGEGKAWSGGGGNLRLVKKRGMVDTPFVLQHNNREEK